jgi:hypothetical protein
MNLVYMHVLNLYMSGRFHVLTEFDEAKRSCRKRLAEHNRRRRKQATTAVPSQDGGSSPTTKKPNVGSITSSYATDNKSNHASSPIDPHISSLFTQSTNISGARTRLV